jgi:hypothetical protein
MTIENQETDSSVSQDANLKVDNSRRSFAKKSAAIAPVIMTLANRSAWAGTNMCTQSGFHSFNVQGAIHSHIEHIPNPKWKYPADWAKESNWPVGFGIATKVIVPDPKDPNKTVVRFESTSLWPGEQYTRVKVEQYELTHSVIILANPVFISTNPNLTLFDALDRPNSQPDNKLLAYKIATALNDAVYALPTEFAPQTQEDFDTFYGNCVEKAP